ncbi:MAG: hypothetical protein PHY94_02470 [Candidatus Omnitrophica bacterium]|nr:hypothetical protein [Candidatus Omnitrophota bacterium]
MIFIPKFSNKINYNLNHKTIALIILALLPIYCFYLMIFAFSANIPYWDDYDSILNFTNNFLESNPQNKATLIFSQHNEHRIVFSRVVTLFFYYLTGKINFRLLALVGNLSLIGLAVILFKSVEFTKEKLSYFIPILFFIFQPQYWGDIYFATSALSNLPVLFFSVASLYALKKGSIQYFVLSLFLAILSTFTNGNGMLVFLAALPCLVFDKKYRKSILWALAGIGCTLIYFYGYLKPVSHPSIYNAIFVHPLATIGYYFNFLGSCFSVFGMVRFLPFLVGILFTLYFVYLVKIKFYKKNFVIFSFFTFLFITAIVTALCRSGFELLPSRYKIISILILALSYLSFTQIFAETKIRSLLSIILIFSILFNLVSYLRNYNYVILQKKYLEEGASLWEKDNVGLAYPDANRANSIINAASIKKTYFLPQ